jgi:hypothetical protein
MGIINNALEGEAQWSGHHDHLTLTLRTSYFGGFLKAHRCVLIRSKIFVTLDRE